MDLFRRHFLKRSDETVARVVDEDIDSTKVIDSVRDDSRRGSWVGYVQRAVISRVAASSGIAYAAFLGICCVSNQFGFLDPTTDTVISPTVALQRLSARDKKRG